MSYDTDIIFPACDHCQRPASSVMTVGNMTSNVGRMYYLVMPGPYPGGGRYDGVGESHPKGGLPGLSGLSCEQAVPILREAIGAFLAREEELLKLEPDNGWGSYDGALRYLREILAACEAHPKGVVAVNW